MKEEKEDRAARAKEVLFADQPGASSAPKTEADRAEETARAKEVLFADQTGASSAPKTDADRAEETARAKEVLYGKPSPAEGGAEAGEAREGEAKADEATAAEVKAAAAQTPESKVAENKGAETEAGEGEAPPAADKAPLPAAKPPRTGRKRSRAAQKEPSAAREKRGGARAVYKVLWAVAAVLLAAAVFAAGYYTYYFTLDSGLRSLLWFKEVVDGEYYEDISDEDFWNAAIRGVEDGLLDRYSEYYSPAELEETMTSQQGIGTGVGLSFFTGTNKVYSVAIGSPAFFAGVQAGMYVTGVAVGGGDMEDTFLSNGYGGYTYTASSRLSGFDEGTQVQLRLSAASPVDTGAETAQTVELTVRTYNESYVLYAAEGRAWAALYHEDTREYVWTDVSEYVPVDEQVQGASYLQLRRFYGAAAGEFGLALEQFKEDGATTLILDLRNDGGGSLAVMQDIAAYLRRDAQASREVVLRAEYGSGRVENYYAEEDLFDEYLASASIKVMANGNTASASEALIGAMISYNTIDYGDVYITDTVGSGSAATYGKGIMQTTFVNRITGEAVKLTTARIYWPNGVCIHGTGITTAMGANPSPAASYGEYGDPELTALLASLAAES